MATAGGSATSSESFKSEFLKHYLSVAIGALGKRDTDALVMHLLDKYGLADGVPLARYPNQEASALLRVPVAKIRQLRHEAALKYGGRVEDQASARLLVALSQGVLELEGRTIRLVIEDRLAKDWLQGQLKQHGVVYDLALNREIVKVPAKGLFAVLGELFDKPQTQAFQEAFDKLVHDKRGEQLRAGFLKLAGSFATEAARKAGGAVLAIFGVLSP